VEGEGFSLNVTICNGLRHPGQDREWRSQLVRIAELNMTIQAILHESYISTTLDKLTIVHIPLSF
jgi:hypothetical protein